jgi:translocation and assembly module TamA
LQRLGFAVAASSAVLICLLGTSALADEPKAMVEGDLDKALRQEIQRAIGESKTRPDSSFDARRRAEDAIGDAIAVLRSEGYYAYDVQPDVSETEPPQALVRVTAGPRFHIKDPGILWLGPPPVSDVANAAEAAIHLTPGAPGRAADVVAAEGRVVASIEKRGYADAASQPREVIVDHADQSLRPTFKIAAGDLVHLGSIKVITDGRTNPAWVQGLSPWRMGAPYDPDKVAELERRLTDVGVYEQVTVALAPKDQTVDGLRQVIVSIADRPPHTLELGAGFSTNEGSGVDAKWTHYNRLGRADTLTFIAKIYDIKQKLDVELALPHWRRPNQTLKIGGGFIGDHTDAFDDAGGGVRLDIERRFSRTSFITFGLAADYADTHEKTAVNAQAVPVGENLKLFIPSALVAFALDRSNDPLDPVRGWRLEARAEPTLIVGDRRLTYLKVQTQATGYLPLQADGDTVIAGRIKVGAMLGGRLPDVPTDRRFFAGGGGSVRGYAYQAVGPRLSDNTPSGGLSLVEASVEARQKIGQHWGVVAFVDAGSVGQAQYPTFSNLSVGAGVGVRYDLGFGPLRLDIATPLKRRQGDSLFQIYLSIGQSF